MRYFLITITNSSGTVLYTWSSHTSSGAVDPGAPKVELDIPLAQYAKFAGQGRITVWGVGLKTISQATQLTGMTVSVVVGMAKGLPLANPNQHGPAIVGTIFQSWGNWINTNQTLYIVFTNLVGSYNSPINLALNWKANQPLSQALQASLSAAFPKYKIDINVSPKLVNNNDEPSIYRTLSALNTYLFNRSKALVNSPGYEGVAVSIANNTVTATDNTQIATSKTIAYTDIIGQPVWIAVGTIQVMFVMRGDLFLGNAFTLPATAYTVTESAAYPSPNGLTFSGQYVVSAIRILGNSRQPHAESWVTVVDALAQPATKAAA